jgi:hypothetical protein
VVIAVAFGAASQAVRAQQSFQGVTECVAGPRGHRQIVFFRATHVEPEAANLDENSSVAREASSAFVREGVWRKLPGNFVHDQKDCG